MLLQEGDELTLGGNYWMQDDTGDEVWRLAEVLERGEDGNLSIKLLESGGVIDIDPVRGDKRVTTRNVIVCTEAETKKTQTMCSLSLPFPDALSMLLRDGYVYSLRSLPSLWWVFPTRRWVFVGPLVGRGRRSRVPVCEVC